MVPKQRSYADLLGALGVHVERASGADVLLQELPEGFLVLFATDTAQQAVWCTWQDLETLIQQAGDLPGESGGHTDGALPPLRTHLRAVGQYLDACQAANISVQECVSGYHLAFLGQPAGPPPPTIERRRVSMTLHDDQLDPIRGVTGPPGGALLRSEG